MGKSFFKNIYYCIICSRNYLERLAGMIGKSTDTLGVEVASNFIRLSLKGAVHNDGGNTLQELLLQ